METKVAALYRNKMRLIDDYFRLFRDSFLMKHILFLFISKWLCRAFSSLSLETCLENTQLPMLRPLILCDAMISLFERFIHDFIRSSALTEVVLLSLLFYF